VRAGQGFRINETLCIEGTSSEGINSICAENADLYINSKAIYGFNTIINSNNLGRVGIGISEPMAKFHTLGNSILDGNLTVSDETILNGDVEMDGIGTHEETENLQLIIKLPSGQLKTMDFDDFFLAYQPPAELKICIDDEDGNIPNPKWFNELNKIYTHCSPVNVGIGTKNPAYKLTVAGISAAKKIKVGNIGSSSDAVINGFVQNSSDDIIILGKKVGSLDEEVFFKITNDGTVYSREIRVTTPTSFPDYVFEEDYELMGLDALKEYIEVHDKLPNFPSAEEVKNEGLDLAEVQIKLVEKVEELTLYVLDLKSDNKALEAENKEIRKELEDIKTDLALIMEILKTKSE